MTNLETMSKRAQRGSPLVGVLLLAGYVAALAAPLALALIVLPRTHDSFLWELGKNCALVAIAVLALQFLLAARLRRITRHYGLDMVLRFHRSLAMFALALIVLHPALLIAGGAGWPLLLSLRIPWYIWAGKAALLLLLIQVVASLLRARIGVSFERWRALHNQAIVIIGLAFLHSWFAGDDLRYRPMQILWIGLLAMAVTSYTYHKLYLPRAGKRRAYRVSGMTQENRDVWTLSLTPTEDAEGLSFLPGQFHFLSLYRGDDHDGEEHPFTISSSPATPGRLTSTIKGSGDFTRTIAQTQPDVHVRVQGPFGRFSYLLHPGESDFVFIAGGIGITPLVSMLRHMRDTGGDLGVLLLYGNRTEEDIAFRDELEHMADGGHPRLTVVHVLSRPDASWTGEAGHIDRTTITRWCGEDLRGKAFYICGPPPMMAAVTGALRGLGVPPARIHSERFAF